MTLTGAAEKYSNRVAQPLTRTTTSPRASQGQRPDAQHCRWFGAKRPTVSSPTSCLASSASIAELSRTRSRRRRFAPPLGAARHRAQPLRGPPGAGAPTGRGEPPISSVHSLQPRWILALPSSRLSLRLLTGVASKVWARTRDGGHLGCGRLGAQFLMQATLETEVTESSFAGTATTVPPLAGMPGPAYATSTRRSLSRPPPDPLPWPGPSCAAPPSVRFPPIRQPCHQDQRARIPGDCGRLPCPRAVCAAYGGHPRRRTRRPGRELQVGSLFRPPSTSRTSTRRGPGGA